MDSGLEQRTLPSIRRSQLVLIYRNGRVANPETCGQIVCSVRRPARSGVSRWTQAARSGVSRWAQAARSGVSRWAQVARSVFCRAESASVADSADWVLVRQSGEPGDLRSDRVLGRETGTIIDKHRRQRAWRGAIQGGHRGPPLRL